MFKILILIIISSYIPYLMAANEDKKNIIYEYKKYEKFDLESMDVGGSESSPGDLSISPRFRKEFKNKIPERRNFSREMLKAIDSVK